MHGQSLRGKIAVITGASRGIGQAAAEALGGAGCHLALASRFSKVDSVREMAERLNVSVLASFCDVRDEESVRQFISKVGERFGRIDILFNNAGTAYPDRQVKDIPVEEWRDTLDTNLTGTFLVTKHCLPLMTRGGCIVNNLSVAAKGSFAGASAYNASKWGALGFTNTLREELRGRGIRVIALMPGATATQIWDRFWPDAPKDKMMRAETIAAAVVHAVSMPEEACADELVISPTGGSL